MTNPFERKTEQDKIRLDETFKKELSAIQNCLKILKRHDQIRIEKWLEKLSQVSNNVAYKKNRNKYIHCLLYMCKEQKFIDPFNKRPTDGALRNVPVQLYRRILDQERQKKRKNKQQLNRQRQSRENLQRKKRENKSRSRTRSPQKRLFKKQTSKNPKFQEKNQQQQKEKSPKPSPMKFEGRRIIRRIPKNQSPLPQIKKQKNSTNNSPPSQREITNENSYTNIQTNKINLFTKNNNSQQNKDSIMNRELQIQNLFKFQENLEEEKLSKNKKWVKKESTMVRQIEEQRTVIELLNNELKIQQNKTKALEEKLRPLQQNQEKIPAKLLQENKLMKNFIDQVRKFLVFQQQQENSQENTQQITTQGMKNNAVINLIEEYNATASNLELIKLSKITEKLSYNEKKFNKILNLKQSTQAKSVKSQRISQKKKKIPIYQNPQIMVKEISIIQPKQQQKQQLIPMRRFTAFGLNHAHTSRTNNQVNIQAFKIQNSKQHSGLVQIPRFLHQRAQSQPRSFPHRRSRVQQRQILINLNTIQQPQQKSQGGFQSVKNGIVNSLSQQKGCLIHEYLDQIKQENQILRMQTAKLLQFSPVK